MRPPPVPIPTRPETDLPPGGLDAPPPALDAPARQAHVVKRYPCSQCGARLEFTPGSTHLRCPFCAHVNEITPAGTQAEELDYALYAQLKETEAPTGDQIVVRCEQCAAEVTKAANVIAGTCPYCASNLVATGASKRAIRPGAVLPFSLTKEQAIAKFRAWLGSRWFAPSALKKQGKLDAALSGLYYPSWTFDAQTVTDYQGYRGEAYYVTVGSGNNRRRERRVRWYSASGTVHVPFDDVLILASKSLTLREHQALAPWDLKACVPHDDAYLSGFRAESYAVTLPEGFAEAKLRMAPAIQQAIRADIGGDEQRITAMRTAYHAVTFKLLLLPVWITAYRYMNTVYHVLVNARTGQVHGQRPYSAWKITGFVLMCLALLAVLVLILRSI